MGTNTKTATAEYKEAAEGAAREKGLVGEALGEIDDISRGMKERTHDDKKLP